MVLVQDILTTTSWGSAWGRTSWVYFTVAKACVLKRVECMPWSSQTTMYLTIGWWGIPLDTVNIVNRIWEFNYNLVPWVEYAILTTWWSMWYTAWASYPYKRSNVTFTRNINESWPYWTYFFDIANIVTDYETSNIKLKTDYGSIGNQWITWGWLDWGMTFIPKVDTKITDVFLGKYCSGTDVIIKDYSNTTLVTAPISNFKATLNYTLQAWVKYIIAVPIWWWASIDFNYVSYPLDTNNLNFLTENLGWADRPFSRWINIYAFNSEEVVEDLSKSYEYKVYTKLNVYKWTIDNTTVMSDVSFSSIKNWGQSNTTIILNEEFTDTTYSLWDIVKIYSHTSFNISWKLIYSWFISRIHRRQSNNSQVIELELLWLASLLSNFIVQWPQSWEPKILIQAIITNFNIAYWTTLFTYVSRWGGTYTMDDYWTNLNIDVWDTNAFQAINMLVSFTNYRRYIWADWVVYFLPVPATETHTFTNQIDVDEVVIAESIEEVVNATTIKREWWIEKSYTNAWSITTYWRKEKYQDKSYEILDETTQDAYGTAYINENKDLKKDTTIVINSKYYIDNIKPWDTLKIRNFTYVTEDLQVMTIVYNNYTVQLQVEKKLRFADMVVWEILATPLQTIWWEDALTAIAFTATDSDTVSRWAWNLYIKWETYAIWAWNTGNMSSKTYIYFNKTTPTVLNITTTWADAVWFWKVLVWTALNSTSPKLATFQIFTWYWVWTLVTKDNIVANTITANEIAADYIYANSISADQITWWTITWIVLQTESTWLRIVLEWTDIEFLDWNTLIWSITAYDWGSYIPPFFYWEVIYIAWNVQLEDSLILTWWLELNLWTPVSESLSPNRSLEIQCMWNTYKLLLYKA